MIRAWLLSLALHAALLAVAVALVAVPAGRRSAPLEPARFSVGRPELSLPVVPHDRPRVTSSREVLAEAAFPGSPEDSSFNPEIPDLHPGEFPAGVNPPIDAETRHGPRVVDRFGAGPPAISIDGRRRIPRPPGAGTAAGGDASPGPASAAPGNEAAPSRETRTGQDAWASRSGGRLPSYPGEARRHGWEGTVELEILISSKGQVEEVTVTKGSGHEALDAEAQEAARTWEFEPVKRDGKPVPGRVLIPVIFRLRG
jgi:protein TonB